MSDRRGFVRRGMILTMAPALTGCVPGLLEGAALTVATPWPEDDRAELARDFPRWRAGASDPGPIPVAWVALDRDDDFGRAPRADLLLGGPASAYARLAERARLVPIERPGHPLWCVVRRAPLGWVTNRRLVATLAVEGAGPRPLRAPLLGLDDPRHSPIGLAWARAELRPGRWSAGYARLVRAAGHAGRIGRQPGSSLAAVARGEVAMAPASGTRLGPLAFEPTPGRPEFVEGVAIARGGTNPRWAQTFLRFLADRGQAEPPPKDLVDEADAGLLADLLGATLVDAQDELWAAWAAVERADRPDRALAERFLSEPPPWPPASARKLLDRDAAGALLETLTEQVAPDADTRAWLVRSWLAPGRPIDGALLDDIGQAVDGRLAREPRFRGWLRAEWTAWARQRYRRVLRRVTGAWP